MRVAAIDIGTNSVLLTVAEATQGTLKPVLEHATITRLGKGVDRNRRLHPDRVDATLACLARYAELIADAGVVEVAVVGTSAMRDARGGDEFRDRVEALLGVRPRVISGEQEARLTFAGALLEIDVNGPVVVVDIGGGSTEIIFGVAAGQGVVSSAVSLNVGSVRLFERYLLSDPPGAEELAATRAEVRAALRTVTRPPAGATLIGVAGTVTTLLAIERGLATYDPRCIHNHRLHVDTLRRLSRRLATLPLAERRQLAGLEPERADVIVAGACILVEIAAWTGAGDVVVSDRGVRWGLIRSLTQGSSQASPF